MELRNAEEAIRETPVSDHCVLPYSNQDSEDGKSDFKTKHFTVKSLKSYGDMLFQRAINCFTLAIWL